jgi:hypothetical protein
MMSFSSRQRTLPGRWVTGHADVQGRSLDLTPKLPELRLARNSAFPTRRIGKERGRHQALPRCDRDVTRFDHIGTIIIVGGDSDFMPVAQKIKAAGRTLVGVGARKNTNKHWAKSCHEFRYYENLAEEVETAEPPKAAEAQLLAPPPPADPAADMLKRAVRLLAETNGDPWVNKASIWPMIKRLDSTFDTKELGHATFSDMVKAYNPIVEVKKGEFDHVVRLR